MNWNWLKKRLGILTKEEFQEEVKAHNARVTETLTQNAALQKEADALQKELDDIKKKDEEKRNSDTPWIEILSDGFDEKKGISISLDWNTAFVELLKENGITGSTEEEVIRKYLVFLYSDLVTRFEQVELDAKERKGTISDFT